MTAHTLAEKLAKFPRLGLAHLPTALEPMKRLSAHLAGPRLWVKREDATGLGFGGNKLRKLDYVLQQAIAQKADTLVSGGVVQSNSQRQVAAAAAKLGLDCHLAVYHGRLAPPTPEYAASGNAFLNRLFGAHLHDIPWTGDRNGAIRSLAEELRAAGKRPYVVPYGVSSALGAVGYASTVVEIAEQSRALGFTPKAIVHCSGSAGTQAGLVVGAKLAMPSTGIVGIDIDAEPERVREDVLNFAKGRGGATGNGVRRASRRSRRGPCRSRLRHRACCDVGGDQAGRLIGSLAPRSRLHRQGSGRSYRDDTRTSLDQR